MLSTACCKYRELSFSTPGEPKTALKYQEHEALPPTPPKTDLRTQSESLCRVDLLNAPWNPADMFAVQGRYGSPYSNKDAKRDALRLSPLFPGCTVAGSEGFGRVVKIIGNSDNHEDGTTEHSLQVGDWVTVGQPGLGTLRSTMWLPTNAVLRIDRGLEFWERAGPQACTLLQLGGTAIRMLRDFVSLQPGDVVLQNAGNSAVSFMVSQLASLHMSAIVVSLVRKGSKTTAQWDELVQHLTETGKCRLVVAEEDLQDEKGLAAFQSQLEKLGNGNLPRLALDSVGGVSASHLLACLGNGGTMITYGGMSRQPIPLTAAHLIYKDLKVHGHWHSRWMVQHSYSERLAMVNGLVQSFLDSGLQCPPVQVFPLSHLQEAMEWESTHQPNQAIRCKLVWDCQN